MVHVAEGRDHCMHHRCHHPGGRCDRHSNIYHSPSPDMFVIFVLF